MTPGLCFPVLFENQKPAERTLQFMTWGLIPSFTGVHVKKLDFFKMFNARLETIDEKPSFQSIAKTNRCVVFLNGYFEWKLCSDTGRKQPYYVARRDSHPLCLAAVFDVWKVSTDNCLKGRTLTSSSGCNRATLGLLCGPSLLSPLLPLPPRSKVCGICIHVSLCSCAPQQQLTAGYRASPLLLLLLAQQDPPRLFSMWRACPQI